jgi:hypothetical protein
MVTAILERAGEAGAFVDASTATRTAIRHAPSGLVCTLAHDGAFDLEAFPSGSGNPGASCSHAVNGKHAVRTAVSLTPLVSA